MSAGNGTDRTYCAECGAPAEHAPDYRPRYRGREFLRTIRELRELMVRAARSGSLSKAWQAANEAQALLADLEVEAAPFRAPASPPLASVDKIT